MRISALDNVWGCYDSGLAHEDAPETYAATAKLKPGDRRDIAVHTTLETIDLGVYWILEVEENGSVVIDRL
jgi:hypothetical protein